METESYRKNTYRGRNLKKKKKKRRGGRKLKQRARERGRLRWCNPDFGGLLGG